MTWRDTLAGIDDLADLPFDDALVRELEAAAPVPPRRLTFSTPGFKNYATAELAGCGQNRFPTFSVTGPACALQCDHCQANILRPMIQATSPDALDRTVRTMIDRHGLNGFLLSGGSNRRNEVDYRRHLPVVARLKRDFPHLRIAAHTGLMDRERALALAEASIDVAMTDIIGAAATIREVYHLDRPVADFAATLDALAGTGLEVVPHIVIGLHYGRVLGEYEALDICASAAIDALVLVVVMPALAKPGTFTAPATADVGRVFLAARRRIPDRPVLLGCARPPGLHKQVTDAYAVMAGLDGIAFPAEGVVPLARALGRPFDQHHSCCAVGCGSASSSRSTTSSSRIAPYPSSCVPGQAATGGASRDPSHFSTGIDPGSRLRLGRGRGGEVPEPPLALPTAERDDRRDARREPPLGLR